MNTDAENTVGNVKFICADNPISKDEHESSMYDLVVDLHHGLIRFFIQNGTITKQKNSTRIQL